MYWDRLWLYINIDYTYLAYFTRTTAAKEQEIEFDTSLLEENENLQANEIMWNNLTADSLQVMWVLRKSNCVRWVLPLP